jgi:hypothetical protein
MDKLEYLFDTNLRSFPSIYAWPLYSSDRFNVPRLPLKRIGGEGRR